MMGLFFGITVGLCAAPLWVMLLIPMRVVDGMKAGSVRMAGWALTLGTVWGTLPFCIKSGSGAAAVMAVFFGGMFVGMQASALTEALEVIPVLYRKAGLKNHMKNAAWALVLGKMCGAIAAAFLK